MKQLNIDFERGELKIIFKVDKTIDLVNIDH